MKDNRSKKELKMQYKERDVVGGVFVIRNTITGKLLLDATTDLQGSINRFDFAQKTDSCVDFKLQHDWKKQGGGSFAFEVLEKMKKNETQTDAEFAKDIKILKDMWIEKLDGKDLY